MGAMEEEFFEDIVKEEGIAEDVAAPHTTGIGEQAMQPFQRTSLPSLGSPLGRTRIEIEDSTNGPGMTVDV